MTVPVRTCAGCRREAPQAELQRYTAVDGLLAADEAQRRPGRGVYTCRTEACFSKARERNAFTRSLRTPLRVPDGLNTRFLEG